MPPVVVKVLTVSWEEMVATKRERKRKMPFILANSLRLETNGRRIEWKGKVSSKEMRNDKCVQNRDSYLHGRVLRAFYMC